jgi:hypothetical protein
MTNVSHKRLYLRWRGNIVQSIEVRLTDGSICQQVFRSSHAKRNYSALLLALYYQRQLLNQSLEQEQSLKV